MQNSSLKIYDSRTWLFAILAVYTLLVFFSSDVPFFWDVIGFSKAADFYFSGDFSGLLLPVEIDNGHPPLYPMYLALAWKIFGKTLFVSHLATLPFVLGAVYEFHRLALKWLPRTAVSFALILLLAEPAFNTQVVLMSPDVFLVFAFLFSLNRLLEGKRKLYTSGLVLLALGSLRGVFFVAGLALFHFLRGYIVPSEKERSLRKVLVYPPSILALLAWGFYRYLSAGWFFLSPSADTDRAIVPAAQMVRHFAYVLWKILDSGRIVLVVFVALSSLYFYIFRCTQAGAFMKQIALLTGCLFAVLAAAMVPLSNPIGHRYFMPLFLLFLLAAAHALHQVAGNKLRLAILSLLVAMLAAGNFWMYPERFGNAWDTSLKCLSYFSQSAQMRDFVLGQGIDPAAVGTGFPLNADERFSRLSEKEFIFGDKDERPFGEFQYILLSNVCNELTVPQMEELSARWIPVKEYRKGQVYLRLYRNYR